MYSFADDGGTQVTQVGENFNPGPEGNAAIAQLLGYEAEVRGDKKEAQAWVFAYEPCGIPSAPPEWRPAPDYCEDTAAVAELMEFEGRVPYVKPLRKEPGQRKTRYVCFFDHEGGVGVTVPFMKGSHALAAALHFVLSERKS